MKLFQVQVKIKAIGQFLNNAQHQTKLRKEKGKLWHSL